MLHVLPYTPDWRSDPTLRSMFNARKHVFIDLLGWELPVLEEAFELDCFDAQGAVYLVLSAPDGSHRASTRLLPTNRPHLLDSLFHMLSTDAPPRGSDVREITRFCLDRAMRANERRQARNELVSALADYGFVHRLSTYTGVAELGWFEQISRFGWNCSALGKPRDINGRQLTALRIDLAADTRAQLAATGIYIRPGHGGENRHAA